MSMRCCVSLLLRGGLFFCMCRTACSPATRPSVSLRIRGHMKRVFGAAGLFCIVVAAGAMSMNGAETTLPAPTLLSPARGETIDDSSPLLWAAVPGAIRYQLELCGDPSRAEVIGRGTAPNLYSLLRRPLGPLYWRVAAVDTTGRSGSWTPITRFTVAHGISGTIYEDVNGDDAAAGLVPRPNVRVRLYRDSGDDTPGDDDKLIESVPTDRRGAYDFHPAASATYWVAVAEQSVTPATS